jgi:UDP-N-acetylglucosamine:LPS N-acetylglucosamine transferase
MSKPVSSIFTTREGHLSIAEAAASALSRGGHKVLINEHGGAEFGLYTPFYQLFPQLFSIPFKFHASQRAKQMLETYAKFTFQDKVIAELKEQKPQVVVSAWFMINQILAGANTHNSFRFYNIVADPRTYANVAVHPDAVNLVFDRKAAQRAYRIGIAKKQVVISGWFVRDRFEAPYQQMSVRKKLKLPEDKLIFLIVAGSEGTATILKILPAFVNCNRPVEVIVACGSSKKLAQTVDTLARVIHASNKRDTVKVTTLGFSKNIQEYMQAADLVMGKAGPNLLFEAVATQTPFFAFTHIAGQEDGNLEIINDYKLGWVEEEPVKAIKLIKQILNHPELIDQFDPHLKKMADINRGSKKILADLVSSTA